MRVIGPKKRTIVGHTVANRGSESSDTVLENVEFEKFYSE